MKMLSPTDALGPAFRRAREVMCPTRRLGFFLKIALIAALTQPGFYSVVISYPMQGVQAAAGAAMRHPSRLDFTAASAGGFGLSGAGAVALFVAFAIVLFIGLMFWVGGMYLLCRLRFTLFDLVVYRQGRVRQAWAKYGKQTWRYFGVMFLASLAFLVLLAATVGPLFVRMIRIMKDLALRGPNPNPWPLFAQMLPFLGMCLLLGLVWALIDAVVQDFVLPPMAIDDAPVEGAFSRFFALLTEDTGSVLVYLLLRFVVAIGISWVMMMVVGMALLILGVGGFAVGFLLYRAMWHGGFGLQVVFIVIVAAMTLLLLGAYLLAVIAVYGIAAVFKQSYAAYFFGSRYPALGNRLEPPDDELVAVRVEPPLPTLPPLQEPPPVW